MVHPKLTKVGQTRVVILCVSTITVTMKLVYSSIQVLPTWLHLDTHQLKGHNSALPALNCLPVMIQHQFGFMNPTLKSHTSPARMVTSGKYTRSTGHSRELPVLNCPSVLIQLLLCHDRRKINSFFLCPSLSLSLSMWHFLKLVARGFLRVLRFPPLLHWLMVQPIK